MLTSIIISAGLLMSGLSYGSYEPVTDSLHAVTVTADKGLAVSRSDTLKVGSSLSVSDALLLGSGFHVSDNGGLSGLKTVSLRGFGSAHTAIYVDGVRLGNVQSGQNDIGMVAPEDVGSIVVDYAQNTVSFNTSQPVFEDGPFAAAVRFSGGSFGTWLPSARLDFRLCDRLSLSASASGVLSKGDFKYGDDLSRTNNDISQIRTGIDLFGKTDGGEYHLKAYYNGVERGTPGSVQWPSEDRQRDRNAFLQGVFRKNFSHLYTLHMSAKTSYDDIFYTSTWGDSKYGQTEFQLNSVHDFQLRRWWKLSLAADLQYDGLKSTNYRASRLTAFSALASSFRADRLSADMALEYSGTFDHEALSCNSFAPSASIRVNLADGLDVIAFGRRAYRVPTFNELYYAGYGNPQLKPEDAWLTDAGIDFSKAVSRSWTVRAKLDGFCNFLTDKISSAPTPEDPAIWAPYNIGKVRSRGFDALAGFVHIREWTYSLDVKYSFLSAVDRTPDSDSYGQQIPYIARHVLVLSGNVSWKGWSLDPVWQMRAGRTDGTGSLPDWNTMDITLLKSSDIGNVGSLTLKASVRNLFDCRYETVSGYPMPGRNFICGLEFKF